MGRSAQRGAELCLSQVDKSQDFLTAGACGETIRAAISYLDV
jgi:hypothetical protein